MYVDQSFSFQTRAQNGITENWLAKIRRPIRLVRDWIQWNFPEVTRVDKILQRVRRLVFVKGIIVNRVSNCAQVRFQDRFTRMAAGTIYPRTGNNHKRRTNCRESQKRDGFDPKFHNPFTKSSIAPLKR